MKTTGMVRQIDDLGRVVIPKEIRRTNGWEEGDPLEIFTDYDTVILKKYQVGCVFCGGTDNVDDFKGKRVCGKCRRELGVL